MYPDGLIAHSAFEIQSDIDVMTLALEKSDDGWVFSYAQGDLVSNKELAAKALVKYGDNHSTDTPDLWEELNIEILDFFDEDWYSQAKAYLNQLDQQKKAEMVTGGTMDNDGVVW